MGPYWDGDPEVVVKSPESTWRVTPLLTEVRTIVYGAWSVFRVWLVIHKLFVAVPVNLYLYILYVYGFSETVIPWCGFSDMQVNIYCCMLVWVVVPIRIIVLTLGHYIECACGTGVMHFQKIVYLKCCFLALSSLSNFWGLLFILSWSRSDWLLLHIRTLPKTPGLFQTSQSRLHVQTFPYKYQCMQHISCF